MIYARYVYLVLSRVLLPAVVMFSQALSRRHFSSGLPEHDVVGLPALSPVWKRFACFQTPVQVGDTRRIRKPIAPHVVHIHTSNAVIPCSALLLSPLLLGVSTCTCELEQIVWFFDISIFIPGSSIIGISIVAVTMSCEAELQYVDRYPVVVWRCYSSESIYIYMRYTIVVTIVVSIVVSSMCLPRQTLLCSVLLLFAEFFSFAVRVSLRRMGGNKPWHIAHREYSQARP